MMSGYEQARLAAEQALEAMENGLPPEKIVAFAAVAVAKAAVEIADELIQIRNMLARERGLD